MTRIEKLNLAYKLNEDFQIDLFKDNLSLDEAKLDNLIKTIEDAKGLTHQLSFDGLMNLKTNGLVSKLRKENDKK